MHVSLTINQSSIPEIGIGLKGSISDLKNYFETNVSNMIGDEDTPFAIVGMEINVTEQTVTAEIQIEDDEETFNEDEE